MDSLIEDARDVEPLAVLSRFRRDFHACLTARADELFELADAVLCADGPVKDLAGLSLAPEHRRGHGALYDAVNCGRMDIGRLRRSLAGLALPRAADGRLVLAADVSNWLRPGAATSPERLFCHVCGRGKSQAQMIPGWPYSVIAALEPGRTSRTAVLDAIRLGPGDDQTEVTAAQVREVITRLRCPLAEFQTLRPAREAESVRDLDPTAHPHYASDRKSGLRRYPWMFRDPGGPETPQQVTVDYVPSGAVDIHRELTVCATDGDIGQVQGLVVESSGHQVTHVLLQEGHMRGRKEVAIPIDAVTKIGTLLIHLSLTRHQVKDLPPVGH
jgi:sporulation protein YlmC with PRC-barrel domain